jgi:hypothetical protein
MPRDRQLTPDLPRDGANVALRHLGSTEPANLSRPIEELAKPSRQIYSLRCGPCCVFRRRRFEKQYNVVFNASRLVAAFRLVHDASLGRETLGMHAAAIGWCLLILWKIQTTWSRYVVRRECCVFRSVLRSRSQLLSRRPALHSSATVNFTSALLAKWQTVSPLPTSCFQSTTDESPRYTSSMHAIELCALQHWRQHHVHIVPLQQHRPGDVHCLGHSLHNAVR